MGGIVYVDEIQLILALVIDVKLWMTYIIDFILDTVFDKQIIF